MRLLKEIKLKEVPDGQTILVDGTWYEVTGREGDYVFVKNTTEIRYSLTELENELPTHNIGEDWKYIGGLTVITEVD